MKVWRDSTKEKSLNSPEMRTFVDGDEVRRVFVKFYRGWWLVGMFLFLFVYFFYFFEKG